MNIDYQKELNDEQYQAVTSSSKKLRVIAGAGTGKTRTIIYRVCYLINELKYEPRNILCITFTNKVAKEMRDRIEKLCCSFDNYNKPLICTYHSFCLQIIRMFVDYLPNHKKGFTIIDDDDQFKALATCKEKSVIEDVRGLTKNDLKGFREIFSRLKNSNISYKDISESDVAKSVDPLYRYENVEELYRLYCEHLIRINAMDFDDLLYNCMYLLKNVPQVRDFCRRHYKCILVDEFQDTNLIQFDILKSITLDDTMLTVVGDPDQAIYSWRGANYNIIVRDFNEYFTDTITFTLSTNYRSSSEILEAANKVISHNTLRIDKKIGNNSNSIPNSVRCYVLTDCESEGIFVADIIENMINKHEAESYSDFAIIYRANYLSRVFEQRFMEHNIPYTIYGGTRFLERQEVKDALAYLKLLFNEDDDLSFQRIMKAPSRGAGDVVFNAVKEIIGDSDRSLMSCFREGKFKMTKNTTASVKILFEAYDKCVKVAKDESKTPSEIVSSLETYLNEVGLFDYVKDLDEKKPLDNTRDSRVNNVKELLNSIEHYLNSQKPVLVGEELHKPTLPLFLQEASIQSSQDEMKDTNKVKLMTVHVAKGLEFKYVFVCGLAENIFPSIRNNANLEDLEEERRLMFVAMTRAEKLLYLTSYKGFSKVNQGMNAPSRFIAESEVLVNEIKEDLDKSKYEGDKGNNSPIKKYFDKEWKQRSFEKNREDVFVQKTFGNANYKSALHSESYNVGDKIMHNKYNEGVVVEVVDEKKIKVQFAPEIGVKTLAVGYNTFKKV